MGSAIIVNVHRRAAPLYRSLYASAVSAGGASFSALTRARSTAAAALLGVDAGGGFVARRLEGGRGAEEGEEEEARRRCVV